MMPQMPRWVMEAIALYDYEPEEADELGFQEGECIRVTLVQDDGWWKGHVLDEPQHIGLFPSNYVQVKTRRPSQSDAVDSARSTTRNRTPQSTFAGEAEDEDDDDGDEADTNRYAPTTKTSSVAQLKQRLAEAERTSRAAHDARRKAEQQKLSKWQNWDDQDEDSGNEEEEEEDNGFYTQEQWRRHQCQQGYDDGTSDDDDNEGEDEGAGHEQEDPDQYEEDDQEYYYGRPPLQSYEEEEEEDGGEDDDQGEENFEQRGYDGTSIDYRTREDLEDDELSQQLDSDDLPLGSGRSSTYSEQELESAATRIAHGYRTHKHREAVKTARQQHASTVIVKTIKKNTQRVRVRRQHEENQRRQSAAAMAIQQWLVRAGTTHHQTRQSKKLEAEGTAAARIQRWFRQIVAYKRRLAHLAVERARFQQQRETKREAELRLQMEEDERKRQEEIEEVRRQREEEEAALTAQQEDQDQSMQKSEPLEFIPEAPDPPKHKEKKREMKKEAVDLVKALVQQQLGERLQDHDRKMAELHRMMAHMQEVIRQQTAIIQGSMEIEEPQAPLPQLPRLGGPQIEQAKTGALNVHHRTNTATTVPRSSSTILPQLQNPAQVVRPSGIKPPRQFDRTSKLPILAPSNSTQPAR